MFILLVINSIPQGLRFAPVPTILRTIGDCSGRHSGLGELALLVTWRNLSSAWLVSFPHTIQSLDFELRLNISSISSFLFSSILEVIVLLLLSLKACSRVYFLGKMSSWVFHLYKDFNLFSSCSFVVSLVQLIFLSLKCSVNMVWDES